MMVPTEKKTVLAALNSCIFLSLNFIFGTVCNILNYDKKI